MTGEDLGSQHRTVGTTEGSVLELESESDFTLLTSTHQRVCVFVGLLRGHLHTLALTFAIVTH